MIKTRTHTLSSSETAFTTAGIDVFESGPTNFVISFSGVNANGTYLKFLVDYQDDDSIYTVTTPTDNLDKVRTQSISKTLYPEAGYVTTYTVDVSGIKTDLSTDRYRINLKLGKDSVTDYKSLKIINSYLYTNQEGSNYLLLTLEGENPRYVGNVIVPFYKDPKWYLPPVPAPFIANDNRILRTEAFTLIGAYIPIIAEGTVDEIVEDVQHRIYAMATENGDLYPNRLIQGEMNGLPSRAWDSSGLTSGETSRGDYIDDYVVSVPEDGIDYSVYDTADYDGINENNQIINITVHDIYPNGIAP